MRLLDEFVLQQDFPPHREQWDSNRRRRKTKELNGGVNPGLNLLAPGALCSCLFFSRVSSLAWTSVVLRVWFPSRHVVLMVAGKNRLSVVVDLSRSYPWNPETCQESWMLSSCLLDNSSNDGHTGKWRLLESQVHQTRTGGWIFISSRISIEWTLLLSCSSFSLIGFLIIYANGSWS